MFGIIVAGRLVQTDFQMVGETQFLVNIAEADSINHIVVFMTGHQAFPEGMGGSGDNAPHPFGVQQISHVAQIGVSVEPLSQIALQTPATAVHPSNVDSFTEFTTKMLENFYNYAASFALQVVPGSADSYVPLNCLHQWFANFQRRLQQNPFFWKN